jgi:hypothetical protein
MKNMLQQFRLRVLTAWTMKRLTGTKTDLTCTKT